MKTFNTSTLAPSPLLPHSLYHTSGKILLSAGRPLTREVIEKLGQAGIDMVFFPESQEEARELESGALGTTMDLSSLPDGYRLDKPVCDRNGTMLLAAKVILTSTVKTRLRRLGITRVRVNHSPSAVDLAACQRFAELMRHHLTERMAPELSSSGWNAADCSRHPEHDFTPTALSRRFSGVRLLPDKGPAPLSRLLLPLSPGMFREEWHKDHYAGLRHWLLNSLREVFTLVRQGVDYRNEPLRQTTCRMIQALIDDRQLLLAMLPLKDQDYLIGHSLNVSILAINLACQLGYSEQRTFELGFATLLHDIGMLRVPPEIRDKPSPLSHSEWLTVQRHPLWALEFFQKTRGLPHLSGLVAVQSHERLDGKGYPSRLRDHLIHDYAKILHIADTYDAITSERPYRKALLPYRAMESLLHLAHDHVLKPEIVRQLVSHLSLFPIGSMVILSNGRRARVIASNHTDFTRPWIFLFSTPDAPSPAVLNLQDTADLYIAEVTEPHGGDELDLWTGF